MNDQAKTYEGMFLLEAGKSDVQTTLGPVRAVLDRSQAEILSIKPWDERKLAYTIRGHKRGLYVLTYFRLDPEKVAEVERDCKLNEQIIRALVLRRDHLSDEVIQADSPATAAMHRAAERQARAAEVEKQRKAQQAEEQQAEDDQDDQDGEQKQAEPDAVESDNEDQPEN